MLKSVLIAVALWLSSLAAGAASVLLAEFGTSPWAIGALLLWLATLGAPTSVAVLLVTWWWPGGSFSIFLALVSAAALIAQVACVCLVSRLLQRVRQRARRVTHAP